MRVGFIGLGVMGYPMAGHLVKQGHEVVVYNRTWKKAQTWAQEFNGVAVDSPKAVAQRSEVVCLCVGEDKDVEQMLFADEGILAGADAGTVIIDHTTASATVARSAYQRCAKHGVEFLDAPVSGGQAGAENGQLTVMLGGDASTYTRVTPVLNSYAKQHKLLGLAGSGQLAKMMNQICIAGIVQGLAEAIHFGQNADLDVNQVIDVISQGAAQSWQMDNRAVTMIKDQYDFGFAVDWMRKDLGIALEEARSNGSTLALTALVDQYYGDVQKLGGNRWDTSSLLKRLIR